MAERGIVGGTRGYGAPVVRRRLVAGSLVAGPLAGAGGALLLAGCGLPSGQGEPGAATGGRVRSGVGLTLAHFYPTAQQENIRRRMALFQEETPGLRVDELQLQGGAAYREKLLALFAADTPPDVMHMSAAPGSGYSFGVFAPLGRFFELTSLARRDRYDLADFYPVALDFNSYGGKLYVIPNDLNVFATYWSQEPFRQGGVTPPPVDWRAGGFDHGALLDAARRLTDRNTAGAERYGILVEPVVNSTLPYLWSNGADVLSRDLRRFELDSPAALDTLQFLADLVLKHRVSPAADELAAAGGLNGLFFKGRMAMHHTGSNYVNQLRAQAKDLAWDVGASPRGRARRHTVAGGAGFAGASSSRNREESWALLAHLAGKASLEIGAREGQMPTRRSVGRSEAFLDPTQPPAQRRVFLDAAENASPSPLLTNWFEIEAVLNGALAAIITGRSGVRDAVAEARRQTEPLLAVAQGFK